MNSTQITTPSEAVDAMARAAITARQIFCIDEPPLPTLLCKMTWSAEEIARTGNLPETVMNGYRRTVFTEHSADAKAMTAQELQDTQAALLEYIQTLPGEKERLTEGVAEWDELLKAAEQDAA